MSGMDKKQQALIRKLLKSKKTNRQIRDKIKIIKQMAKNKSRVIGPI